MKIETLAAAALLLFGCAACSTVPHKTVAISGAQQAWHGFWNDDGVEGPPAIKIVISQQMAFFYKGDQVVGESIISSGRTGYDTPPGSYTVIQKDENHRSTVYGAYVDANDTIVVANVDLTKAPPPPPGTTFKGAPMPYFLRFTGGYGMHAGDLPGYPASHGCVRMPADMAEHFFESADIGTPVTVEE
jgi:lipoprotein-anchoring transpeptidase ErfK/SrfK